MNKVTTINLNGNAYQFEEAGYEKLQKYLAEAKAKLSENPDKDEIVSDLEQAIADKCNKILNPHKTVVLASEVDQILKEMGPIENGDPSEAASKKEEKKDGTKGNASGNAQNEGTSKRLYRIREGSILCGVCPGLAAYFNVDVAIVRILFGLLVLITHGFGILAYFVMVMVIPYADTSEEKAAAYGYSFNAQELINRARQGFYDMRDSFHKFHDDHKLTEEERKQKKKEMVRQMKRQARYNYGGYSANSNYGNYAQNYQRPSYAAETMFGLLKAAIAILWILGLLSLIMHQSILGLAIPASMPLWVAIVIWVCIYSFISWPFKAARFGANYYESGWNGLIEGVAWIGLITVVVWLVYRHVPVAHDALLNAWQKVPANWQNVFHFQQSPIQQASLQATTTPSMSTSTPISLQ